MSKHTPGPWRVEPEDDCLLVLAHPYEFDLAVVLVAWEPLVDQQRPERNTGSMEGNARLIASAPDLLLRLRHLVRAAENRENTMGDPIRLMTAKAELQEAIEYARFAVCKAEGESDAD